MKYFYDTEFLEDGKTIDLISIGIVAEDGREYYAVNSDMPTYRIARDPWLMENVMSSIGHEIVTTAGRHEDTTLKITDEAAKSKFDIGKEVADFLNVRRSTYDLPKLWAWYGAYDHVALAQLWGKMIHLPKGIPMWTNDLRQKIDELGVSQRELPAQPAGAHNALEDARWLKVRYEFVEAMKRG